MTPIFNTQFDQYRLGTRFIADHYEHDIVYESQARTEKWRRVRCLGEGSSAKVWLEQDGDGKYRAVKQISKPKVPNERELVALTELSENLKYFVQFFGWFEDNEFIYFAMEYAENGNLYELLEKGNILERDMKVIAKQLLAGLQVMHENNFCHRDIKPENILVVSLSPIVVKIADFGTSKQIIAGTEFETEDVGSERYIAPEVTGLFSSETSVYSNAVDIWSLGCLIHFMLTDSTPFPTFRRLNHYVQHKNFPEAELRKSNAGSDAIAFVIRLMRLKPSDRLTAEEALMDPWLCGQEEGGCDKGF